MRVVPDKLGFGLKEIQEMTFDDAKRLANSMELDLICINEKQDIYTITNGEKYRYMLKKVQKPNKQKRMKTIKVKNAIGEADLSRKLEEILLFKKEGHPVRIEIGINPRYNNAVVKKRLNLFLVELATHYKFAVPEMNERVTIINI